MATSSASDRGSGLLKHSFVTPALLLLIAFNLFPLVYNIVIGFSNMKIEGGPWSWIGGLNYTRIFDTDSRFAEAFRTTALFVLVAVTVELVAGFLIALAIKDPFPAKPVVLMILLLPMMLSPAVMGAFWKLILDEQWGVLNQALTAVGLGAPPWTSDTRMRLPAILMMDVWMWTPFMMLISLAALNSIPKYIYEAAEIDRAGRWTVFRRITLPMCAPLLFLAVLLRTTDALKQFDFVMPTTGPNDATTQTVSAMLFEIVLREGKVGLGSAYGFVVLIAVIALATVFTRYIGYIQRSQGKGAA